MSVTIITNNQPRLIIDGYELSDKERADFDYIKDWDSAEFVRYKGELYDLNDLEPTILTSFYGKGWQAMQTESFFSGVLFKYVDNDNDHVIVGRFYA